jgi:hypothetical protein
MTEIKANMILAVLNQIKALIPGGSSDPVVNVLGNPAQAGEASTAAGLVVTALGSPAQAGEASTAAGLVVTALGSPAQEPSLTVTRVKIDQSGAAGVTVLIAALPSSYSYLHAIFGTMAVAGTLTIEDSDGTDISGPMPIGTNGGIVIPAEANKKLCLRTAISKGLSINTSQKFYGYAIVSQATAD